MRNFFALLLSITALGCVPPEATDLADDDTQSLEQAATNPAIAWLDSRGNVKSINLSVLVKRFADGGPISEFRVAKLDNGHNLLRIGKLMSGATHSDGIRLVVSGKALYLPSLLDRLPGCVGGCNSGDACIISHTSTQCHCGGFAGPQCEFGLGGVPGRDEILLTP